MAAGAEVAPLRGEFDRFVDGSIDGSYEYISVGDDEGLDTQTADDPNPRQDFPEGQEYQVLEY